MTTEQQRKMLECAAKACEVPHEPHFDKNHGLWLGSLDLWWNPLTNPADTAEMCAKMGICTLFFEKEQKVSCGFLAQEDKPTLAHIEPYGGSRIRAWRHAATMVAAKIGGYEE